MDDCVEWCVSFLSCIQLGLVPVGISTQLPTVKLLQTIKDCDAKCLIVQTHITNDIIEIIRDTILLLGTNDPLVEYDAYNYHPDEFCFWIMSSGTSGEQKYAVHRHDNLINLYNMVIPAFDINQHSVIYSTPKLSFTYGLNLILNYGLGAGATVILSDKVITQKLIFDLVTQYNVTHFYTTPRVVRMLLKDSKQHNELNNLKVMACAGEVLPIDIAKLFEQMYNIHILEGYGLVEALSYVTTQTNNDKKHGTMGKPLDGIVCEVRDSNGTVCVREQIGELYIKTPCSATLYWNNWSETKQMFVGDWIKTNDMVYTDNDNNLVYVGRSDDLAKINGFFVSPIEIENAIMTFDGVDDCLVTINNNEGFNTITAKIILAPNIRFDAGELRRYLKGILESFKIPKYFKLVESLPLTVTNKKIRKLE
jgi:benzoate-CoA ligase